MVEIIEAASTGDYSFYKTHHAPEKIYLQLINSLISNSAADEEQKLWSPLVLFITRLTEHQWPCDSFSRDAPVLGR